MINFDAADSHKPVVMTNASHSTTNASTASNNSSNNRIADKIPFAKYMKPKMDSILESHCEQSASNSIQNKCNYIPYTYLFLFATMQDNTL